ncbi:fucose 4-O-acetylase-like acetyltransferase [Murinocardiopsis flavida]|uniref:Fucose 4-O-acetylase-like acetyltransferase n=1 Tax=Murinocardiopsis flavida TaxID=645275 RepID=A0A2P8DKE0_9ACTN|nr:acyltransferase family protein [Murinocardiopsis flavida]PSK97690.1 fucose 4-O-acetylase-like acetyltransferase [Murinocardiopsis flavida]
MTRGHGPAARLPTAAGASAATPDAGRPPAHPPGRDAPDAAVPRTRLLFADNARVVLTVLVVLHHSALSFGGPDAVSTGVLTLVTLIDQSFFMGLFFLLAGYFTPASLARKGVGGFLADRFRRLLLPLAGYVVLLSPITALDAKSGADLSGPLWRVYLANLSVGALWFLEVLLAFTLAAAAVSAAAGRWGRGADPRRTAPPSFRAVAAFVGALALLTYLVRIGLPFGAGLLNVPTPSHLPQYLAMFALGALAYQRDWFRTVPARAGTIGFAAAGAGTLLLFPVALVAGPGMLGGGHWASFVYALWEAVMCVGMAFGVLALFRRRFDRQGRLGRYLSGHAFTVFLLHLPVIAGLTVALDALPEAPFLAFALGAPLAVAVSFALAGPVRSLPLARRVL